MLEIDRVTKTYGEGARAVRAIREISLRVEEGQFVSIVGPSGSGKTTLLLSIAGLQPITDGEIRLHGDTVTGPPEELAVVFQDYARSLFPWLTSAENVALPLKDAKEGSREDIARATEEALTAVGLNGAGDRYPWQLSGGMQQRVAIARALAMSPAVLLMDEPFASVDAQTRNELEDLLLSICEHYRMTVVFITHDIEEAVYLSDRVVVLSAPPAEVVDEVPVPLPRPRDQISTKEDPAYLQLRSRILRQIASQTRGQEPDEGHDPAAAGTAEERGKA